jgi:hypothetical protein
MPGGREGDQSVKELPVPECFQWVPEEVRGQGGGYEVDQM